MRAALGLALAAKPVIRKVGRNQDQATKRCHESPDQAHELAGACVGDRAALLRAADRNAVFRFDHRHLLDARRGSGGHHVLVG